MTVNSPYLRTTRDFPSDPQALSMELNKMYIDISNATNSRTVGLFPTNKAAITGEEWFLTGSRQQTLRQVYQFTSFSSPLNIPHGINLSQISNFTRIYGTAFDGTNYYPLPYVDVTAANNQINIVVGPTNITITAGAGSPPAITSGLIVLEWLSQV